MKMSELLEALQKMKETDPTVFENYFLQIEDPQQTIYNIKDFVVLKLFNTVYMKIEPEN